MSDVYRFRPAEPSDARFLATAILTAEALPTGDTPVTMYERIFDLTRAEVEAMVLQAVSTEGRGHQLTWSSFHVIEQAGQPVATCASWVEGAVGQVSGLAVAMIVSRFIGNARFRSRTPQIKWLSATTPRRTMHALQLESFYVAPHARGVGLTGRLIDGAIAHALAQSPTPAMAEIILLQENVVARRAYERAGFAAAGTATDAMAELQGLTGSNGFLLLQRRLGA